MKLLPPPFGKTLSRKTQCTGRNEINNYGSVVSYKWIHYWPEYPEVFYFVTYWEYWIRNSMRLVEFPCNFNSADTLPTLVQYFIYSNRAGRPLIAYSLYLLCTLTNHHNPVAIKENIGCHPCSLSFHNKLQRPCPFDRLSSTVWRTNGEWFNYQSI